MAHVGWRLCWRMTAGGRGRQQEGNSASEVAAPSMKRQKRLPILKTPGHRAQKPRFCAREAPKQGLRRVKAHKNPDFVLKTPENRGSEAKKSTKTQILCSKSPKMGVPKGKSAQKPRFCAREEGDWQWEEKILASESATVAFLQITAHASKIQIPHNQIINFYQRAR